MIGSHEPGRVLRLCQPGHQARPGVPIINPRAVGETPCLHRVPARRLYQSLLDGLTCRCLPAAWEVAVRSVGGVQKPPRRRRNQAQHAARSRCTAEEGERAGGRRLHKNAGYQPQGCGARLSSGQGCTHGRVPTSAYRGQKGDEDRRCGAASAEGPLPHREPAGHLGEVRVPHCRGERSRCSLGDRAGF